MNPNISYKDLTSDQCVLIYEEAVKNSERRWKSALLQAGDDDLAGAIKDHILSIEELIKGLILYLDANGFEFRKVEGMDRILRKSHSLRHFIAFTMMGLSIVGEAFKMMFRKFMEDKNVVPLIKNNPEKFQEFIKVFAFKNILKMRNEFIWFRKVELLRQGGGHVDFDSGTLISPFNITTNEYQQALNRLSVVRDIIKDLMKTFNPENKIIVDQIEEFKNDFKEKGWYSKMGETLVRLNRKNPFDALFKSQDFSDDHYKTLISDLKEEMRSSNIFPIERINEIIEKVSKKDKLIE